MIERIKSYNNLIKKEHYLICPECDIELKSNNICYSTYPPMYPYFCPKCGYQVNSYRIYPWTEIVGDLQCTYRQEVTNE